MPVQNRTDAGAVLCDDPESGHRFDPRSYTMPFTIAVVVALTSAVTFYEWRVRRLTNDAGLGWMSVQWLTEHRRSNVS